MNDIRLFSFFLIITLFSSCKEVVKYTNPLDIEFGDPYVLLASDDTYYMFGTTPGFNGFKCYKSDDLVSWEHTGVALDGNTGDNWGVDCFWAPEVYEVDGKFYMFYSANWKVNPTNEGENFRIGIAVSEKPEGPYKNISDKPLFDPGYPVIDGNLIYDDEGRCYMTFSRCCYKNSVESEIATWAKEQGMFEHIEESWIYGIEISTDFTHVIGEPVLLLRPPVSMDDKQSEWESRSVTSGEVNRRWTEGTFMLKQDGVYYMMYSANFFGGEHYAVGYATSNSPLGPFKKSADNPILQKNIEQGGIVTGTGHNSVTWSKDGKQMYCVYHGRTKATGKERVVFIDKMRIEDGRLIVDGPTTEEQEIN